MANLIRADLSDANLGDANLCWAYLSEANLIRTDLNKADLSEAYLIGAHLSWADLSKAHLSGAYLSGADLIKADLSGANLGGANLSKAYLCEADLSGTDLSGANLNEADLSGANLNEADLSGANLNGADLSGANFNEADLNRVEMGAKLYRKWEPLEHIEHHYHSLIGFRVSGVWNLEDLQTFARCTGSIYNALLELKFGANYVSFQTGEEQIKIHRIIISSPGGISLIGIPEVIREFKELVRYIWLGHKIDELEARKKCLELLERWLEMRIKYYGELRDVELQLPDLCKGIIDLKKLEVKGKLADILSNLDYLPEPSNDSECQDDTARHEEQSE